MLTYIHTATVIQRCIQFLILNTGAGREYFLQRPGPGSQSFIHRHMHIMEYKCRLPDHNACQLIASVKPCITHYRSNGIHRIRRHLGNNIAIRRLKCIGRHNGIIKAHAKLISKSHFAHSRSHAAKAQGIRGKNGLLLGQRMDGFI